MNCPKCGNVLTNLDQVCPNCGEPNASFNAAPPVSETPVAPVEPVAPVVPEAPAAPVEPVAPVVPEAPVAPVEPVAPVVPEAPVAPLEPVAPVVPEAPVAPLEPVAPVVPEAPAAPVEPVAPVVPEAPAAPVEPVAPIAPEAPAAPVEPVAPIAPETPAAPVEPSVQEVPVVPGISVTPTDPIIDTTNQNTTTQTPKKKKNSLFVIMIIILVAVILGLGGFIGYKLLYPTNQTPDEEEIQEVPEKPTQTTEKKEKIVLAGLTFTIPSGLTKKVVDGETILVDTKNGYMIIPSIFTDEASLNDIKAQYPGIENEMKTNLESKGGSYIGATEYIQTGRTFYGISYYVGDLYTDVTYSEIGEDYLFGGQISYKTSSKDVAYKAYNEFLSSAELEKGSTFAKTIAKENLINKAINVNKELK